MTDHTPEVSGADISLAGSGDAERSLHGAAEKLDEAWEWLCHARRNAPDNADIWDLRHHWPRSRERLLAELVAGRYQLRPMLLTGCGNKKKEALALWSARDALVLKWVALCISPMLHLPSRCEHVKGHGGGASSVARMTKSLQEHRWSWVCRTDVKGYYGSMNKRLLMDCVYRRVKQPVLRALIEQYVHYTVEDGGEFHTPEKGIARGCALSPLMGALYLAEMDEHFSREAGIYYARYMDDVVILAKTRWQLRRHVRTLNQYFNAREVEKHPEKTFTGRTNRGFDWMGAQMNECGVEGIAQRALSNHRERVRRLYERFRHRPAEGRRRMSVYRKRWALWALTLVGLVCSSQGRCAGVLDGTTTWTPTPVVNGVTYANVPTSEAATSWSASGNKNVYASTFNNKLQKAYLVRMFPTVEGGTIDYAGSSVEFNSTCTLSWSNPDDWVSSGVPRNVSVTLPHVLSPLAAITSLKPVPVGEPLTMPSGLSTQTNYVETGYDGGSSRNIHSSSATNWSATGCDDFTVHLKITKITGTSITFKSIQIDIAAGYATTSIYVFGGVGTINYKTASSANDTQHVYTGATCTWKQSSKTINLGTMTAADGDPGRTYPSFTVGIDCNGSPTDSPPTTYARVFGSSPTGGLLGRGGITWFKGEDGNAVQDFGLSLMGLTASTSTIIKGKDTDTEGRLMFNGEAGAQNEWWTWPITAHQFQTAAGHPVIPPYTITPVERERTNGVPSTNYAETLTNIVTLNLVVE